MRESLVRGGARIREGRGLRQKSEGSLVAARMTSAQRWLRERRRQRQSIRL